MKRYLIIFLSMTFVLLAQEPDWFTSDLTKKYPTAFYLVGTASNPNLDAAIQLAQNQIASQIRVNINSETNLNISESAKGGEYSVSELYEKNITSYINQTLTGVELVHKEKSGENYYVLATLRKDKFLEEIEAKLDELKVNINSYLKTSDENLINGDIQNCLVFLLKARTDIITFNSTKAFYNALSNIPYDLEGATDQYAKIESDISRISSAIKLTVVEGDEQRIEVGSELSQPIKYLASVNLEKDIIPIKRLPLIVYNQSSTIIDRLETDENGNIVVKSIPFASAKNKEKISAKVNASKIDDAVRDLIDPAPAEANITTFIKASNNFDVAVLDGYNNHIKDIESKVGRILTQCGQNVGGQSDYIIKGKIDDYETSEMNSFKGKMITAKFTTDLELMKKSSGAKLGFIKISGTGVGKDKKEAVEKALRSVNIKTEDVLNLISNL